MSKALKIVHWTPRILCICAILFVSLFALDAFGHGGGFWKELGDFIIHLIPSFILLLFLIIAWKWELIGGIVFTVIASITLPFILVGILFIISYYMKKKQVE